MLGNYALIASPVDYTDPFTKQVTPAGQCHNRIYVDPDSGYIPPEGLLLGPDAPMYEPPPPVPATVATWQLKVVLRQTPSKQNPGKSLLDDADALAAKVGGPTLLAWNGAATCDRASPTLLALAPHLGLAAADIDAAFVAAAGVRM